MALGNADHGTDFTLQFIIVITTKRMYYVAFKLVMTGTRVSGIIKAEAIGYLF